MTDTAADHIAISQLIARYNILGDRGRVEAMLEVFAADARLTALEQTVQGHRAIAAFLAADRTRPTHTVTRHHLGTQLLEIDGDTARARTYFVVFTNIGADHHGVYVDRLIRQAGRWTIAERDVRLDWQAIDSVYRPFPVHRRGAQAPA